MIRGTTHDQDARFPDKNKKMLENSKWPDKYNIKIDLTKIDVELIKTWIERTITKLIGQEDDITTGTINGIIQQNIQKQEKLNAKQLHVAISGFLQEKTLLFVSQLWDILDQAQRSSRGIPECLLQEKMKSEGNQRKRLQQLNNKKSKLNSQRFNRVITRITSNNQPFNKHQDNINENQLDRIKNNEAEKKERQNQKKKRHRERSRSRQYRRDKQKKKQKQHKHDKKKIKREKQRREKRHQSKKKSRSKSMVSNESSEVVSSSSFPEE